MATAPAAQVETDIAVELRNVNKWYGEFHVLRDVNLTVRKGEKVVICGPSGSGKSTMIRCINRLEEHQRASCSSTASSSPTTCATSTPSAARSAWCSSRSTCSRI